MVHVVLLFHLLALVSGFVHCTLVLTLPPALRRPPVRAYTVTFASTLLVLLGSAVVEYAAFNISDLNAEHMPFAVELVDSLLTPLVVLSTLPALADSLAAQESPDRLSATLKSVRVFFGPCSKWVAVSMIAVNCLGTVLVRLLPAGSAQSATADFLGVYRGGIVLPVCYGCMTAWVLLGMLDRPWRRYPILRKRLLGYLSFLLVMNLLLVLEIASRAGRLTIPLFSEAARSAAPFGLQLPWIMLVSYSVAGSVTVRGLAARRDIVALGAQSTEPPADIWAACGLSARETQIAELVMSGASNKEIAKALDISYSTVKNHIAVIFEKCGVGSRFELARKATGTSDARGGSMA